MTDTITKESLKAEVDRIIAMSADYEVAHGAEDSLHLAVIYYFCPKWAVDEIKRLEDADFARHCA